MAIWVRILPMALIISILRSDGEIQVDAKDFFLPNTKEECIYRKIYVEVG